jgi:hypothetical protein
MTLRQQLARDLEGYVRKDNVDLVVDSLVLTVYEHVSEVMGNGE